MNVSYRSYLTAGVSLVGAGAIALSTVQPLPESSSVALEKATSVAAVNLTATQIVNPLTAWSDAFKLASENLKTINGQKKDPGPATPIIAAVANNFKVYLNELPDVGLIGKQILGNIKAAGGAVLDQNIDPEFGISLNTNDTEKVTCIGVPDCKPITALTKLTTTLFLAGVPDFESLVPLINTLSSPVSGAILGWAGPGLSALSESIEAINTIVAGIKTKDFTAVINELINYPAHMFNAIVNGGGQLDLTPIVEKLAPALGLTLPEGTKLGLATGGFLTPAVAMGGGDGGFYGWGGTAWDAISAEATLPGPTTAYVKGIPVGNAATQYGERYAIAKAITLPMPKAASRAAAAVAAPASDTAVAASAAPGNNRSAVAAARAGAAKPAAARAARGK